MGWIYQPSWWRRFPFQERICQNAESFTGIIINKTLKNKLAQDSIKLYILYLLQYHQSLDKNWCAGHFASDRLQLPELTMIYKMNATKIVVVGQRNRNIHVWNRKTVEPEEVSDAYWFKENAPNI